MGLPQPHLDSPASGRQVTRSISRGGNVSPVSKREGPDVELFQTNWAAAFILGALILSEPVTWNLLVGWVAIVAGITLAN